MMNLIDKILNQGYIYYDWMAWDEDGYMSHTPCRAKVKYISTLAEGGGAIYTDEGIFGLDDQGETWSLTEYGI